MGARWWTATALINVSGLSPIETAASGPVTKTAQIMSAKFGMSLSATLRGNRRGRAGAATFNHPCGDDLNAVPGLVVFNRAVTSLPN